MKSLVFLFALLVAPLASATEMVAGDYLFTVDVTFGSGQKTLSKKTKQELRRLIDEHVNFYLLTLTTKQEDVSVNNLMVKQIVTTSRTDASGDAQKNQAISQVRAEALEQEIGTIMAEMNIDASVAMIDTKGIGEEQANESECHYKQKMCKQQPEAVLPWDAPMEPCYVEVMVCPASQRLSTVEVVLSYKPNATPEKIDTPSIIEVETKKPEPTVESEPAIEQDPAPVVEKPVETEEQPPVEGKKPNKLKVYGSELE